MQFTALIVDSNIATRSRLKQASHFSQDFKSVYAANTLKEAIKRLNRTKLVDVVFISAAFHGPDVVEFIKEAKGTVSGGDTAYVLLFSGKDNDPAKIANRLLEGVDAFLVEPYNVNSVSEIAVIARKVKRKNAEVRLTAAAEMLVRSAMDEIDTIAMELVQGRRPRRIRKQLRQAFAEYHTMGKDTKTHLYEVITRLFETAQPRPITNYRGASRRVKALLMKKGSAAPSVQRESESESAEPEAC